MTDMTARHVASWEDKRNAYQLSDRKVSTKQPFREHSFRLKDNTKVVLFEDSDRVEPAYGRVPWRAHMSAVMYLNVT
jgi:hypothetical protein